MARGSRIPAAVVGLLFLLLAPRPAGGATVHPVPLQQSDCAAAPGAASFTGHALFQYRIETTGAVQGVKLLYADVQPPERKAGFVAESTSCLEEWKFKPAMVDGIPAATVMKVAFHRLPPGSKDEDQVMLWGGRTVPKSFPVQVRAATLAFTDALLKGKGYREAKGNGWLLRTDLPKTSLDDLQKAIDFAQRVFDEAFPGPAGGAGAQDLTLILFKDDEEYQQVSAFDNIIPERAPVAGQYDSQFRMIYSALGDKPLPAFARTMAHEATHHFASQRIGGAHGMPRWLSEGIAQYVECVKTAKPGKVRLEALDRGQVEQQTTLIAAGGHLRGAFVYQKRVEVALANLEENLGQVDLAQLLDGRIDRHFFDEGALTLYDVSWLLVHYLMNGDGRRYRDPFRTWAADAAGPRNAETFAADVGIPAADLRARLQAHLAQIK